MMLFFILAGALVLVVLGLVLRPLFARGLRDDSDDRARSAQLELYEEQLRALDAAAERGEVSSDAHAEARAEAEKAIAGTLTRYQETAPRRRPVALNLGLAATLLVAVPGVSAWLYQVHGTPAGLEPATAPAAAANHSASTPADIPRMVGNLEAKLRVNPANGEGWHLLGRSYFVLERYQDAVDAYERAQSLLGTSADLLVEMAEAMAMGAGTQLRGAPRERLERALALEPNHPKGLWLAGFAAFQAGEHPLALAHWQRLDKLLPQDGPEAKTLATLIASIQNPDAPNVAPAEDRAAAMQSEPAPGLRLKIRVDLDPALRSRLRGGESLFVFARNAAGPPMPVAAVRRLASELPLTVFLDDSNAMIPSVKLSNTATIELVARVSSGAGPTAKSGDLEGALGPLQTATAKAMRGANGEPPTLNIVIDRVVP